MKRTALLASLAILAASTPALAHPGHGLVPGFLHPFTGLDHLVVMLAVGAWGATIGGRALWAVPVAFLAAMMAGAAAAMAGVTFAFTELVVLGSVAVLCVCAIGRVRMPVWAAMLVTALFAVAHGQAHGAELPFESSPWVYAAGFLASTALLHALGAGVARLALSSRVISRSA